jgi:hypothetical protein
VFASSRGPLFRTNKNESRPTLIGESTVAIIIFAQGQI